MKKSIIMLIIFVAIISVAFIPANIVLAGQSEMIDEIENAEEIKEDDEVPREVLEDIENDSAKEIKESDEVIPQERSLFDDEMYLEDVINEDNKAISENEIQEREQELIDESKASDNERKTEISLQVPQKLDIMLDPFEINGKGQVFSDQYFIKNTGEEAGILTLSKLVCKPAEDSGIIIKADEKGIHHADEKLIHIKMLFGNGDAVILSSEENEYKVRLEPGEEITFSYSGEINENASQSWKEHDVTVGMTYSWEIEDEMLENEIRLEDILGNVVEKDNQNSAE